MDTYKEALDKARTELAETVQKRDELNRRIIALESTIAALDSLSRPQPQKATTLQLPTNVGITDAIRYALKQVKLPMSAPQIRDYLAQCGFDMAEYASALTVIHNTAARLHSQGEVIPVEANGRSIGWRFKQPSLGT